MASLPWPEHLFPWRYTPMTTISDTHFGLPIEAAIPLREGRVTYASLPHRDVNSHLYSCYCHSNCLWNSQLCIILSKLQMLNAGTHMYTSLISAVKHWDRKMLWVLQHIHGHYSIFLSGDCKDTAWMLLTTLPTTFSPHHTKLVAKLLPPGPAFLRLKNLCPQSCLYICSLPCTVSDRRKFLSKDF